MKKLSYTEMERLHDKGIDPRLEPQINLSILFSVTEEAFSGKLTEKEAFHKIRYALPDMTTKAFTEAYYGHFSDSYHQYILNRWGSWVGIRLPKNVLEVVMFDDIEDWEEIFCSESSIECMVNGAISHRSCMETMARYNMRVAELEREIIRKEAVNDFIREFNKQETGN